jgi:hypothetical protein
MYPVQTVRYLSGPYPFRLLSPLGERLGEGVMQEAAFALNPLT